MIYPPALDRVLDHAVTLSVDELQKVLRDLVAPLEALGEADRDRAAAELVERLNHAIARRECQRPRVLH